MESVVYHGSNVQDLKELIPKQSTQLGKYVYATNYYIVAAVFAARSINRGKHIMPKFGYIREKDIFQLIERFPNQFDDYKKPVSVYYLDSKPFKPLEEFGWEGKEVRAKGKQKVLKEDKIDNLYEYLKSQKEYIELVDFKDRFKYGIPKNDVDLIKQLFDVSLMKLKGREKENILKVEKSIEQYKNIFPNHSLLVDRIYKIISKLNDEESKKFVSNLYDYKNKKINTKLIEQLEKELLITDEKTILKLL